MTNRQTDHATCVATNRIFTLCIAMRPKNYSERQNWRHQFRGQHEWNKAVVNTSSLLLAPARARCVFVHVAVSVRLPSPRALRRNAYINQCYGRSTRVPAGWWRVTLWCVFAVVEKVDFVATEPYWHQRKRTS